MRIGVVGLGKIGLPLPLGVQSLSGDAIAVRLTGPTEAGGYASNL